LKLKNSLSQISYKAIALFIITAFLLPSFGLIINVAAEEQTYQNITIDAANYMIEHENKYPNLVILDVRDTIEYNLGHLYDSILIPLNDLEARIGELEDYKTSEIIIYCKSGYRSQQASEILVEYGFTKAYNMLGGILAWIDADYPIWTTSHHITVDEITDKKFELLIEPQLLYYTGCSSCTENQECPIETESINITSEILEQEEDYIIVLITYESNGITYEYIFTQSLLWKYSKTMSTFNETAYFISTEITTENTYTQFYQLIYLKQHENYKLTISTRLNPLNTEIYNNTYTYIEYIPAKGKSPTSMEFIQFNEPVTLSQQFMILGEIAEEMAKIYESSEDANLMELSYAYNTMANEIKEVSQLVQEQLLGYDWQILESFAVLTDAFVPNGGGGGDPPPPCTPDPDCIFICEIILYMGIGTITTIICAAACTGICAACVVVWFLCIACLGCLAGCGALAGALIYLIGIYGVGPGCAWFCCQI